MSLILTWSEISFLLLCRKKLPRGDLKKRLFYFYLICCITFTWLLSVTEMELQLSKQGKHVSHTYGRVSVYVKLVPAPGWSWLATKGPPPPASHDNFHGCLWSRPAPGFVIGKVLVDIIWAGLSPMLRDAVGLLACGPLGRDLILDGEISYFSLTSKALLHTSFQGWWGGFSHWQWTGAWETFVPFMQQLVEESTCRGSCCWECCYFCFSLSAVVTGVTFTGCWCHEVGIRLLLMGWKTWMHWQILPYIVPSPLDR